MQRFSERMTGWMVLAATLAAVDLLGQAPPGQGQIQVRGLNGSASVTVPGSDPTPLRAGMMVPIGAIVKTDAGSAVDLSFSHNAGVIRLVEKSTLSLNKFSANAAAPGTPGTPVEIQLYLTEGTVLGFDKHLPSGSRYQVKAPHAIAEILGSKYRFNAQGYLVLLDGTAAYVAVPATGEPVAFDLKTPPAAYFSPVEGVKPAPIELVREIVLQTKGKLRK